MHAELGRYLLIIKIQKRAVKFYNHLKGSDSQTFHNNHHLQRDEPGEESPKQAGPGALFTNKQTPHRAPRTATPIRPNQIMKSLLDTLERI
jgi:hypothetical protein